MASLLRAEVRLAALPPLLAEAEAADADWMSEEERSRHRGMGSEKRRREFLVGHWLIRNLAAEVLGGEPREWLLDSAPSGAPRIRSPRHNKGAEIAASISHSGGLVAAAIAPFDVGIDLERDSKPRDLLALAANVFSPEECAQLRGLPESERANAFYLRWTLKEAVGKREGHGLRPELARTQQSIACTADEADVIAWQFEGCCLAVAGAVGMSVRVDGLPDSVMPNYWRIEPAPA